MRERVTTVENIGICKVQSIRVFERRPIVKIAAKALIPIFLISLATPSRLAIPRYREHSILRLPPVPHGAGLSWQGSDAPPLICVKMRSRTYGNLNKTL